MKPLAIIYDRASSSNQADNWSRRDAEIIGNRLASQYGYQSELRQEVKSGESLLNRPVMVEILNEIEQGKVQAIIVQNFSRLSRDEDGIDGLTIKRICKVNNVPIITPGKVYDLATSQDDKLSDIELMVARWYKSELITYIAQGMTAKALFGGFLGGVPPFGYKLVYSQADEAEKPVSDLAICEAEISVINELFGVYCDGIGANATARHLNALGYRIATRRQKQTKDNTSKRKFARYDILRIVERPLYIGFMQWGKNVQSRYLANFETTMVYRKELQIIPVKVWELANTIKSDRSFNAETRSKWSRYAFSGTLGCLLCQSGVSGWRGDGHITYRCDARHRSLDINDCRGFTIRQKTVSGAVIPFLADLINNHIGLDASLNDAANEYGRNSIENAHVNQIELELHTIQEAKQRVMDFIADGVISKDDAGAKLQELKSKEDRLRRKIVETHERDKIRTEYLEAMQSLKSVNLETTLHEMLEDKPATFKRLLQMVFKPNSLIVQTKRAGNTWWGELVSYKFTDELQGIVPSSNGSSERYKIQFAIDLSELLDVVV